MSFSIQARNEDPKIHCDRPKKPQFKPRHNSFLFPGNTDGVSWWPASLLKARYSFFRRKASKRKDIVKQ